MVDYSLSFADRRYPPSGILRYAVLSTWSPQTTHHVLSALCPSYLSNPARLRRLALQSLMQAGVYGKSKATLAKGMLTMH